MLRLTCPGVSRLAPLSDQLPPIFLGGQTAAHGSEFAPRWHALQDAEVGWQKAIDKVNERAGLTILWSAELLLAYRRVI